jgi:hypothetical protein
VTMQVKQTRSIQRTDGNNQRTGATGAHVTFRATEFKGVVSEL